MLILDSERSDEFNDFTMIITSRNIAPISNFGVNILDALRGQKLTFSNSFQKNREKQKKITENREFLRKTTFHQIDFFMVLIQKLITEKFISRRYLKIVPVIKIRVFFTVDKILLALSKYLKI
ncbi:Uncharacterized protein FWK35_00030167 [Aphis craccivora]|uniref:Uncharacterized protein n=1 Tax=Aphis craccivora TaxID=307492 RepID=A0A6G0YTS0_APHCR|nr:Uncharacterized protein FWK35_00030167 [Aphis craccivora]